ncbi:MAG: site-specific DNA-methyltransferase [Bacteroidales bacterium]|nr:site-specific DNA-methyltransferase [Bacteroidales bacterium]
MNHTIYFKAAQQMSDVNDESIDIVVTSPPYPMIEMWDDIMSKQKCLCVNQIFYPFPNHIFVN